VAQTNTIPTITNSVVAVLILNGLPLYVDHSRLSKGIMHG
jgi:hypothetical protein